MNIIIDKKELASYISKTALLKITTLFLKENKISYGEYKELLEEELRVKEYQEIIYSNIFIQSLVKIFENKDFPSDTNYLDILSKIGYITKKEDRGYNISKDFLVLMDLHKEDAKPRNLYNFSEIQHHIFYILFPDIQ